MILLDTHILIWVISGERKIGRKARALIDQHWNNGKVAVSAISFWEVGMLQERNRLQLTTSPSVWREEVIAAGVIELALDGAIAVRALDLSALPGDPADRFIAATALVHGATLVTANEKLLAWKHALERLDGRT